jgi:hypothetical protein
MPLPNLRHLVEEAIQKYPDAFAHAHRDGDPRTEEWINLCVKHLREKGHGNVFLNGKRGTSDASDDCVAYVAQDGDVVDPQGVRFFIVDVIAGAGGPSPSAAWASVGGPSPGRLIEPRDSGGTVTPPPPPPPPQHACNPALAEQLNTLQSALIAFMNQVGAIRNDTLLMQQQLATLSQRQDEAIAHVKDVRQALRNGLAVEASADLRGWGSARGPIHGTAKG